MVRFRELTEQYSNNSLYSIIGFVATVLFYTMRITIDKAVHVVNGISISRSIIRSENEEDTIYRGAASECLCMYMCRACLDHPRLRSSSIAGRKHAIYHKPVVVKECLLGQHEGRPAPTVGSTWARRVWCSPRYNPVARRSHARIEAGVNH